MTVFSRITAGLVLACIATSTLLSSPVAASKAIGARHLKHHQARAHHVGSPATGGSKRSVVKKAACAAKATSSTTTSYAPTSTSSSAAQTTTPSSSNSGGNSGGSSGGNVPAPTYSGGGKAGLGWLSGQQPYIRNFLTTGKVNWCYTWSPWACCVGDNCESVPMLWSQKQVGDWNAQAWGTDNPGHVLAFNEPEQVGQSNMDVPAAIALWWQYIEPMTASRKGAPAVTASPQGFTWIDQFMQECVGCTIDFVPFHWYGTKSSDLESALQQLYGIVKKPIWVTEWACQDYGPNGQWCDSGMISALMAEGTAFMDNTPWVERYAWFAAIDDWSNAPNFNAGNGLLAGENPTALGYQYMKW